MIDCFVQKWAEGLQNRQSRCGYFIGPFFILGFFYIIMQSILINVEDNKLDVIKVFWHLSSLQVFRCEIIKI